MRIASCLLGLMLTLMLADARALAEPSMGPPPPGVPWAWVTPTPTPSPEAVAPEPIPSLLKPAIYKRVLDREVMDHASLDGVEGKPELSTYSYYVAMSVNADVRHAREVLTNYALYAKMIPYVDSTRFDPATRNLALEGGIWKFKLKSNIHFDEKSERWIHYRIVGGHFTGLEGDILFEPEPGNSRATLVYMRGALTAARWPPKFVIEEGAQIVFGFTANHMRSYLESSASEGQEDHGGEIPEPRSHL